ncbi:type VII toxin-antitoxin system MntA family adenylyltransferase antitoxin [Pseudoxanthomonas spadix]|jgi:predicted nucleotidyltransferase|uniref:type VII toxin-antitoxin system MntA family adenylyltransferase antitoxin n=1 Tax=Pseudoxanthomonas spadix TaxID=415229 RepID=UPI000EFF410A|nr:nucleotidyltransferase domain-containing protein [Pseudoxanthomonas spadix]MBP3973614.1 nucleotidyltransferase domain-containing protein [Pseudoxanthomonas spadix]RMW94987.1 nucleotidyltransferase domain-containing protein [Pseudoxanthomonas spadix]
MSTTLSQVRDVLERQPGIRQALVFGSVASGMARADSDLDIAVDAGRPLDAAARIGLIQALAAATGRAVDLIDLRTVGEPLLGQILKHGRRVVGSDAERAELIRRHLFDAEDFLPYVERMLQERRRAWIG